MFTVQKGRVPRLLMKNIGATGTAEFDFDRTQWPFSSPSYTAPQENTQNLQLDTKEKQHHLKTLGPIMGYVGSERIGLVKEHTDKILELAYKFPVAIKGEKTSHGVIEKRITDVLTILLESTLGREGGDYSVVGHEAVAGLQRFADTELTLTKLKQM